MELNAFVYNELANTNAWNEGSGEEKSFKQILSWKPIAKWAANKKGPCDIQLISLVPGT